MRVHARNVAIFASVLALELGAPALAATTPPGINVRWDNCYDDGGVTNKVFACDTNSGSETLVLSFVLDTPMSQVNGMETRVHVFSASASLPDWWRSQSPGTCRQALAFNTALNPSASNCLDWSAGGSFGGIGSFNIGLTPDMATLRTASAVPLADLATLDANREYFIANLKLSHAKTVGSGACPGCNTPVCIVFSQLNVVTPDAANNRILIFGANSVASQLATWQSGLPVNPHVFNPGINGGGPQMTMDNCIAGATGVTNRTWGAVKALYR